MKNQSISKALFLATVATLALASVPGIQTVRGGSSVLAAFTYNPCVMCAAPGDVVFFNANTSLSLAGSIVSYTWNFGDGSPLVKTNSSLETHDFLYAIPGHWLVTLTVQDINGMTDTISQTVLFNVAPDFKIQSLHLVTGQPVTFNATTTRVYQNTTGHPPGFLWNFGDGTNGTGILAIHRYQAAGPYRVLLTITTGQGTPTVSKILVVGLSPQGGQQVQTSFDNVNATIYGNITVNGTTHTIIGTVTVIATNVTTGTIVFSETFNLTIHYQSTNNLPRFMVAIKATNPRLAITCTINTSTGQLACFLTKNPDINGDGTVDMLDYSMATYEYGATRGSPRYNPAADLDDDGTIDLVDIAIIGLDYAAPTY
jgi:hypothetical protein